MIWRCLPSRRWRILIQSCLLATAGAVVPIVAMVGVFRENVTHKELDALQLYAEQTIKRADQIFGDARQAIETVEAANVKPCSPEHIEMLRDETITRASVEEIGFFENGLLRCTSWGLIDRPIRRPVAEFFTHEGLAVTLNLKPIASVHGLMTSVGLRNYNVLVMPSRFVDITLDSAASLELSTDRNQILAVRDPSNYFANALVLPEGQRFDPAVFLLATSTSDDLMATVVKSRDSIQFGFADELPLFLVVGAMISCCLLGAVYWFSAKRLAPAAELDLAIANKEFYVEYQPIVDLQTERCIGAEALVRWRLPDGTVIRPDIFIPLAEETGQILPITDLVIDRVFQELSQALSRNPDLHIALNLSASDIQTGRVLDYLDQKRSAAEIRSQQIWLEATERGFMDVESARLTIARARNKGYAVAIDDFGTGYSNLQYLQTLPVDAIKIDKAFVESIGIAAATSSVVMHIIEMTHELGLVCVAEGVETREQAMFLKENGVAYAQGWHYSKPLSAVDFVDYVQTLNKGTLGKKSRKSQVIKRSESRHAGLGRDPPL